MAHRSLPVGDDATLRDIFPDAARANDGGDEPLRRAGPVPRPQAARRQCCDGDPRGLMPIEAALASVLARAHPVAGTEWLAPLKARGRVAAAVARSAVPLPPFDQSAVDGYGFHEAGSASGRPSRVASRIEAGRAGPASIKPGEAVRLFTGAAVPTGVAAVVKEEDCVVTGGRVRAAAPVEAGANIRWQGEDIPAGAAVIEPGTVLDARHVALLAAAGCAEVEVVRPLRVMVMSTGSELCPPDRPLSFGQIYDSNRPMLLAMLDRPWIDAVDGGPFRDSVQALAAAIGDAAGDADVIFSTGGASASETDHIAEAIRLAGGAAESLSIAVKPGKPVVIGRVGTTAVLGLPGNPVAAMVGFLLFGRPLARACVGVAGVRPRGHRAVAARTIRHARGRTEFIPVRIAAAPSAGGLIAVEQAGRSGSARLAPLAAADGLAEIPAGSGDVAEGAFVTFHPFHPELAL
jgi:molybdopterin molybdotransferase